MSDLVLLSVAQMRWIEPLFPCARELPRVDDRGVLSGIVCAAPHEPPGVLYNRLGS